MTINGVRIIRSQDGKEVTIVVGDCRAILTISQWSELIANPDRR